MSEHTKDQLIYEIAEELIQKFDVEISQDILLILNKHFYNYGIEKRNTSLVILDSTTEKILKLFIRTKRFILNKRNNFLYEKV